MKGLLDNCTEKELLELAFSFDYDFLSESARKTINKVVIKNFPFLAYETGWSKNKLEYDCAYSELGELPVGWRVAFGLQMFTELKALLKKAKFLKKYHIIQIKEKFGRLQLDSYGVPDEIFLEYLKFLDKYEECSRLYCIRCGRPTKYFTGGYYTLLCEDCFKETIPKDLSSRQLKNYKKRYRLTWLDIEYSYKEIIKKNKIRYIKIPPSNFELFKKQWKRPRFYLLKVAKKQLIDWFKD